MAKGRAVYQLVNPLQLHSTDLAILCTENFAAPRFEAPL